MNWPKHFYERTTVTRRGRLRRVVLKWVVLAVHVDEEWQTEDGKAIEVALLRADAGDRYVYRAMQDWEVANKIEAGLWSRRRPKGWA